MCQKARKEIGMIGGKTMELSKEAFKESVNIILQEISRYLQISGEPYCSDIKYSGQELGKKIQKQMNNDWAAFTGFIRNRLDDDVLDMISKDYGFKDQNRMTD